VCECVSVCVYSNLPLCPCRYQPWELCMLHSHKRVKYFNTDSVSECMSEQHRRKKLKLQVVDAPAAPAATARGRFYCRLGHIYHK
jgi:hypothetical protein